MRFKGWILFCHDDMTEFFSDIVNYDFLRNATIASVCSAVICGIVGTYIVIRRLVFLSGGITHASFGGIGIAYYLGINPIWGALVFAAASALGMTYLSDKMKIREDSVIGILWAIGMATGILFISLTPGYAPNLMSFLLGNILTVDSTILWGNILLAVLLGILFLKFNRLILFTAFDPTFSGTQQLPIRTINFIALTLVAIAIVFIIKLIGIMLLISLLTIPPITANLLSDSYNRITVYAIGFTVLGNLLGLYISYCTDLPSGASIVIVLGLFYLIVRFGKYLIRKKRQCKTR